MKLSCPVVALSLMLLAAPTFAQAPAPAPRPAAPAAPAAGAFPEGAKYAFVNVQRIATESAEGKVATNQVQALNSKKVDELNTNNKQLQTAQQKLESGGSVLSAAAQAQLQKEVERLQVDIQRFTEDAQAEVTQLQQQLQDDFQRKLTPIIQGIATEKQLHMMFSVTDSGLVWGDPALDLTPEVIRRFDAAAPSAATRPAPAAAAPAAASRPAAPAAPAAPRPAAPRPAAPATP